MALRYLDEATVKAYVRSETVTDTPIYTAACYAAEEFLDDECARHFEVAGAAAPRVFRPRTACSEILWLPDFTSVTSVVENGVTLVNGTDFVVEPFNQINDAGKTVPYDRAVRYGTTWYYDGPKPTVTWTSPWGWAAIPYMVVEAGKVAAKAYVEYRDIRFGLAEFANLGVSGERDAKAVWDCIHAYKSHRSRNRVHAA